MCSGKRFGPGGSSRICGRVSCGRYSEQLSLNVHGHMKGNADLEGKEGSQSHSLDHQYSEIIIRLPFPDFLILLLSLLLPFTSFVSFVPSISNPISSVLISLFSFPIFSLSSMFCACILQFSLLFPLFPSLASP